MKITVRENEGIAIIDLEGNININASDLVETIGWALINKSKDILCNFEGVNLVDYVGISVIAVAYKNVLNQNGRMKIYNVPVHVKNLFAVVGLNNVFECYNSEEEAILQFKEEKNISKILKQQLRRRFKRVDLRSDIEYKPISSSDTFYKGKIFNLSAIGIFMIADKIFPIGQTLSTLLHLFPKPGILEVETKVVWVADEEIQPLESPGMGLEFYNLSSKMQVQIIAFVEKHLIHIPRE
ncbi:MAG: STAS domain-containing protein [Candidatus Omnitrophota bacterium]|nr:PilZ domain-containing protein [Candidatus Omnitrophota bacterium]